MSSVPSKEPSASSSAATSRSPAVPLEPTDRWLVVKKGGAKRGTANADVTSGGIDPSSRGGSVLEDLNCGGPVSLQPVESVPTTGPLCDPWADEQREASRSRQGGDAELAAEDWEVALEQHEEICLGGGKAGVLDGLPEDRNQWKVLEDGDGDSTLQDISKNQSGDS